MLVSDCLVSWFYACCLVAYFVDFGLLFLLRLFSWFLFSWLLVVELLHDNRRDNNNKTTLTIYKIIIMIACINSTARTACANWNGERYSSGSLILAFSNTNNDGSSHPTTRVRMCMTSENDVIFVWLVSCRCWLFCWTLVLIKLLISLTRFRLSVCLVGWCYLVAGLSLCWSLNCCSREVSKWVSN